MFNKDTQIWEVVGLLCKNRRGEFSLQTSEKEIHFPTPLKVRRIKKLEYEDSN